MNLDRVLWIGDYSFTVRRLLGDIIVGCVLLVALRAGMALLIASAS